MQKWIRSIACFLVSIFLGNISVQSQDVNVVIQLSAKTLTYRALIAEVEKSASIQFTYGKEVNSILDQKASLPETKLSLQKVLDFFRKSVQVESIVSGNGAVILKMAAKSDTRHQLEQHGAEGRVSGTVTDEESGSAVAGATITIQGKTAISDIDGNFQMALPAGMYTARVSFVGYAIKEITDIAIRRDEFSPLHIVMVREKGSLGSVTVLSSSAHRETVAALYVRQKNAAGISDGISAEQISRTPDKTIAETLKRISGLTSLDNKYVVVRGLSERYNQAMLNGQMMPSTELNRKNFSYDIVPSNLVDRVIVTKTLTPDLSAEFGGGLVQIETKDIPAENFLSVTVGTTANDQTTGKNFRSPKIESGEYWGGINDSRKLFGRSDWKSREEIASSGYWEGSALKDPATFSNNWGLYNYTPLPSLNGQLSWGHAMQLKKEQKLGFIASATYRNTWQTQDIRMSRDGYLENENVEGRAAFSGKRYGFGVNIGGLAGVGYSNKTQKVSLQTMYLRTLDRQFVLGTGLGTQGESVGYYDMYTLTSLWQNQIKTEHLLNNPGIKLNTSFSYTLLDRNKPDNHQATMNYIGEKGDDPNNPAANFSVMNVSSSGISEGALRFWSRALEKNLAWTADLAIPFRFKAGRTSVTNQLKTGYAGWQKDRLFWVLLTGSKGFTTGPEPLNQAFDPAGGGSIYTSRFGDDFHKKPSLHAGYLMMDNKIGNKLRLVWGARGEYYKLNAVNAIMEQFVAEQKKNNGDLTDYSDLFNREPDWNFFPSANITYSLTPKMNLRLAYSKSIIRPDIREISYFKEYDFELGGSYWSQSPIISTKIHHYDFRYEWYPGTGEVISLSLFYKKLLYPMEIFTMPNRLFELRNDKDAINKGVEVEARKSMAFTSVPVLKDITLYGNFTRLFATVREMTIRYDGTDASNPNKLYVKEIVGEEEKRPQSGASNFLYNVGINYDHNRLSISGSLNMISNRFYRVGDDNSGSLYEQPMQSLDAQIAYRLLKDKASVKLNLSNLLNSKYRVYTNLYEGGEIIPADGHQPSAKELRYQSTDQIDYEAKPGRTVSLSFTYNF